jgi:hypothetical protein
MLHAGSLPVLELRVAAVDDEVFAGVVAAGVAGDVDGDAGEVRAGAPAAHGDAADDGGFELLIPDAGFGHGRFDPAGGDGV